MANMKNSVAERAGISLRFLDYLLEGRKNASARTAVRLAEATGIPWDIWVFASSAERREAWKKFQDGSKTAQ